MNRSTGVSATLLLLCSCAAPGLAPVAAPDTTPLAFTGLARNPAEGWHSDAGDEGRLTVTDDASAAASGSGVRVDLVDPATLDEGHQSLMRVLYAENVPRQATFSVDLKGDVAGEVLLAAYVWNDNIAQCLAKTSTVVDERWRPGRLAFDVPPDHEHVGLFVYFPRAEKGSIWLRAAQVSAP
ncbi:MAG: hypothetical protein KAI24_16840 [Planctomycetes bacterium]|nr:hypothetical protein [Planctomycetota bacterium]